MKIKKKSNFSIGDSFTLRLVFKMTHSNFFVTLSDINDKVISCKTPASSGVKGRKKRKKAPQSVERVMAKFRSLFMLYKIKNLELFMDKPFFAHLNYLSKEASYFGYNISKVSLNTYKPHNGVRGKKIRRR